MDPLSLIASIAGISQAGASLSKAIYELISSARGAPKEVADIARGIADLSVTLGELRRVLREGTSLYRRKLLRNIRSAMKRIAKIHGSIGDLINVGSGVGRLKWAFRRSTSVQLLYQIEAHKSAINMVLQTMMLAVQIRLANGLAHNSQETVTEKEIKFDRDLARHQAENTVESSIQSLRELKTAATLSTEETGSSSEDENQDLSASTARAQHQLILWNGGQNDTAAWLYQTVFSPYAASLEADRALGSDSQEVSEARDSDRSADSTDLQLTSLNTTLQKPPGCKEVVNELLAEWTNLTEDEIQGVQTKKQAREAVPLLSAMPEDGEESIHLKDAVGRKFIFPYHKARTWEDANNLIKEAFLHVDIIGPHVIEGHFDLILANKNGIIVLPSLWSDLVKPDSRIEMRMWPIDKPKPPRRPRSSIPPTTIPPPGMKPPPPPSFSSAGQPPVANSERRTSPAPTKSPEPQPDAPRASQGSGGFNFHFKPAKIKDSGRDNGADEVWRDFFIRRNDGNVDRDDGMGDIFTPFGERHHQ